MQYTWSCAVQTLFLWTERLADCGWQTSVVMMACVTGAVITTCKQSSVFSTVCDFCFFLFVNQIPRKWLNGFVPNSQGRQDMFGPSLGRVWMSRSKSKVKVTRDKEHAVHSHHPPAATEWNTLAANNVTHEQKGPFCRCRRVISAACVRSMFGKISLPLYVSFRARVQPTLDPYAEAFL